jgi:hypothetical protein
MTNREFEIEVYLYRKIKVLPMYKLYFDKNIAFIRHMEMLLPTDTVNWHDFCNTVVTYRNYRPSRDECVHYLKQIGFSERAIMRTLRMSPPKLKNTLNKRIIVKATLEDYSEAIKMWILVRKEVDFFNV